MKFSKVFLIVSIIGFSLILLSGCGQATSNNKNQESVASQEQLSEKDLIEGAKKEGKLTVYHTVTTAEMRKILQEFEKAYPFIKTQEERQSGIKVYQKFLQESESGVNIADIVHVSDIPAAKDLAEKGFLLKYKVPTDDLFDPKYKIAGTSYIPWITEIVVLVNSNKVSEEDGKILQEWEGILDPRWKGGKIGVTDPSGGASFAPIYLFLKENTRFGETYLKKLAAQDPKVMANNSLAHEALISGETSIQFASWLSTALNRYDQGQPVRWYTPKPTPAYGNSAFSISSKAPHPNAAKLFQNWLMSEDGAKVIEEVYRARATIKGWKDSRKYPDEPWVTPISEVYDIDHDWWAEHYDGYIKTWREIFNYNPAG
jgi:ABC-type Fe3+ transport system substrate-binding protein